MERNDAQRRMTEIQRIMEQTTLYTLLPGVQAIIGGALVLIGCVASWLMLGSLDFGDFGSLSNGAKIGFCVMWALVASAAIVQEVVLTTRAADQAGVDAMARPGRLTALSMAPCVLVALALSMQFMRDGHFRYIASIWIMCYGASVYSAGLFSVQGPRLLGLTFILIGAIGMILFPHLGVLAVALSFGLGHVVFGLWVTQKTRRIVSDEQPDQA